MIRWYAVISAVGGGGTTRRYCSAITHEPVTFGAPDKHAAQAWVDKCWPGHFLVAKSHAEWEVMMQDERDEKAQAQREQRAMSDACKLAMLRLKEELGITYVPLLACALTLLPNQVGLLDADAGQLPPHTLVGQAVRRAVNSQRYAVVGVPPQPMVVAVQLDVFGMAA